MAKKTLDVLYEEIKKNGFQPHVGEIQKKSFVVFQKTNNSLLLEMSISTKRQLFIGKIFDTSPAKKKPYWVQESSSIATAIEMVQFMNWQTTNRATDAQGVFMNPCKKGSQYYWVEKGLTSQDTLSDSNSKSFYVLQEGQSREVAEFINKQKKKLTHPEDRPHFFTMGSITETE